MNNGYNTKQKQAVLGYLKKFTDRQLSAAEIAEGVEKEGIGKSTVYRQIKSLCQEGSVRRFRGSDGKQVLYQYFSGRECSEHFHLKCNVCGKVVHLDCRHIDEFRGHIIDKHGFYIDTLSTVIYGCCGECAKAKENGGDKI